MGPILGRSNKQQKYVKFEGFPLALVSFIMTADFWDHCVFFPSESNNYNLYTVNPQTLVGVSPVYSHLGCTFVWYNMFPRLVFVSELLPCLQGFLDRSPWMC